MLPACAADCADAKLIEQQYVEGQQRLTDVKARVAVFLRYHHIASALGEQRGDGETGGPVALRGMRCNHGNEGHLVGRSMRTLRAMAALIIEYAKADPLRSSLEEVDYA